MSKQILNSKIAEPYASALLNLAVSTHSLDLVTADVNDLVEMFSHSPDLEIYLSSPVNSKEEKKAVLKKILLPLYFNKNSLKFLMILIERGRINLFSSIADLYLQKVYEVINVQIVNITSAFPLSSVQEQNLITALSKIMNTGEIKLVATVDKSLLGGFQVKLGSYLIDASLKAQLRKLATKLDVSIT